MNLRQLSQGEKRDIAKMSLSDSLHIINNNDVPSEGWFDVYSPVDGTPVGRASLATLSVVDDAIASAQRAFTSWSRTTYVERRNLLNRTADILESMRDEISVAMITETGAKKDWTMGANLAAAVGLLREVASMASQVKGEVIPSVVPGTLSMVVREPAGVVFAIAPWNSPIVLSCRAVAAALLCGNTVILKSSEYSPRTQRYVVEAFRKAGLPAGVLNYLNMSREEAPRLTEHVISHTAIRRVNFTGSDRVGKIIAGHCAKYGPKQCVLELGGKSPIIVLEDADLDAAADAITFSSMMHSGQVCFSAERVLVLPAIADQFVEKLKARIEKLWSGPPEVDGRPEQYRLGPLIQESAAIRARDLLEQAKNAGAQVLVGDLSRSRCFIQPHLLDHVPPTCDMFEEETFAPICSVTRVQSVEEAVQLANQGDFTLSAAVFGSSGQKTLDVTRRLKSGAVHINGPTLSFESNRPYGGCGGLSGYGRFGGTAGIEEYTDRKVITFNEPGNVPIALV